MPNWTAAQQDAINARGGTLLVSAAAGSGKTAVLVQRVIERLTDPQHPSDADRLLVVTFTKAAAAEMKERISLRISELLAGDPENLNLQRQQILLERASISTVHSFCSELVRENFYKLEISPDFRISDESEMAVLREEAITCVMEECYDSGDPEFLELVEAFSSDRDDIRLVRTVNQLYDFTRSHPFPERWLKEKAAMYNPAVPAGETPWGKCLLRHGQETVEYCISLVKGALLSMEEDEKIAAAYGPAFQSDLSGLERLKTALDQADWNQVGHRAGGIVFPALKPLRGYGEDPLKNRLSACRKEIKDTIKKLTSLFSMTEEECKGDLARISPLVKRLFDITLRFSNVLDALKAERRIGDFGDLEHWALRLLVKDTANGVERTALAKELSLRYDEIMVDEYQDTNEAQDMLFRAISREEGNLFLVGDVKQSIYSFRQAMPRLFLDRRRSFPEYDRSRDSYPACVVLDRNFRSRPQVTDAVNFVFRQIMSSGTGDVDYAGKEFLVPAADYAPEPGVETRLDLLDLDEAQEPMELVEARHIAGIITRMIGEGFTVMDRGKSRPAVFQDFCILLRSSSQYAPRYARELQLCGVPAWADASEGFFKSREIAVVISLLRVIDNPVQDIPLLSVLLSPIYGFSPDDLAEIRTENRGAPLYIALWEYAERNGGKAQAFLEEMERFRTLAATMPADRLINIVYEKTGYWAMVQAMRNGELRLANLQLLLEHAKKYESSGYNGLSGFIRFIDRLQSQQGDLPGASALSESANVVRVMSIHKSKGLEFPVCILAGCARNFNKDRGDALLHPALGLGIKLKGKGDLFRYTTLPREAVSLELRRESMSEELRVLYVAMTRAKEKLILVASVKKPDRILETLASHLTLEEKIPPYVVRNASCIADWLLSCALRHPSGSCLRKRAGIPTEAALKGKFEPWQIQVLPAPDPLEKEEKREQAIKARADGELLERLKSQMDYSYPWAALKGVPAKVAASELAAQAMGEEYQILSRPAFLGKGGLTPAERGTALHCYMQFAEYQAAAENPQAELDRLLSQGFLTQEQAGVIDLEQIRRFFNSSVAKRMFSAQQCMRELRFTVELPAGQIHPELDPMLSAQPVLLQGAVDCVFVEGGQAVILDYKTDRAPSPGKLWQRYCVQLELYRLAAEQFLELPVKQCLLYSFYFNRQISKEDMEKPLTNSAIPDKLI